MKKSSIKQKKALKGTNKISSYFVKLSNDIPNKANSEKVQCNDSSLVIIDSDDEFDSVPKLKSRILDLYVPTKCGESLEATTPESRKRTYSKENTPSPDIIPCSLDYRQQLKYTTFLPAVKSRKKMAKQCNSAGTADRFYSPNKNRADFKPLQHKSPERSKRATSKSPGDKKKTSPSKLFNKSPKSLRTFDVEKIEKFVNITPSKSNGRVEKEDPGSSRSLDVQLKNESTPKKCLHDGQNLSVSAVKLEIKTKLDFDSDLESLENGSGNNDILNDSWEFENLECHTEHTLDLTNSHHCKIVEIERQFNNLTIIVSSTKDNTKTALCNVEGFWINLTLSVNNIIHISAVYDHKKAAWIVSNDWGLIVLEPDHLVSTTSVVGALFCKRRAFLFEKYRGFESYNKTMVIGSLVHRIFQDVLKNKLVPLSEIEVVIKKILLEKHTLWMLYESNLEMEDAEKELMEFAPRISSFMKQYLVGSGEKRNMEDWKGSIDDIQDIEENIWCPELGLKGKVDVSIQNGLATLPLELKTGRATVSLEHRGQVMLYIMMMNKLGYNVPSGLLLYLREGVIREIPITPKEMRDLIILRNELTYYLTQKPTTILELPPPINHHSACSKCPYNAICCTYLKFDNSHLSNNPLKDIQQEVLAHLQPQHIEYFVEWSTLLNLEGSSNLGTKPSQDIYTVLPEKREKNGQCIISATIKEILPECGGLWKHAFEKKSKDGHLVNLLSSGIGIGNYVVVSTDSRPAVATGFVTEMDHETITIALDRNLIKRYSNIAFHLDTYNSSISQAFNMTNLSLLLEQNEQAERLREIVIDKKLPTFNNTISKKVAIKGTPILRNLNKMQQKAVLKALACKNYLLIKGMPGTGKTATIVSLIQILVELDKSVLITSHTHSAVDNVCVRLQERGVKLLRLGAESKIHPKLHEFSEDALTKHCVTPQQLKEVYNKPKVVAVTCLGSGHPALNKRHFDVCIVDESTQVLQSSIFRALYCADKFLLIGDPNQLPPVVRNREAIVKGISISLFERLDNPKSTVSLSDNYRMNKPITDLANSLTYNGELLTANEQVANATLKLPFKEKLLEKYKSDQWIINLLDDNLNSSIKIVDTGQVWKYSLFPKQETSRDDELINCKNSYEIALVDKIVNALLDAGVSSSSIGIIAPYRVQVKELSQVMETKGVEVSTVDQYQGKDKDIIIYSCTKSSNCILSKREFEILEDKRRLTVAITRAKHKFILIGDLITMNSYNPFARLLASLEKDCFIELKEGSLGFSWKKIITTSNH